LFPAELTVFSAVTGVGKSTMLKMLVYNLVCAGFNVLHVTNEESDKQVKRKYDALCSELNYLELKRVVNLEDEDVQKWVDRMEEMKQPGYGAVFVKEIPQFSTVLEIERTYMILEQQGVLIDAIVIDYMDHIAPTQRCWSENDEQAKVAADCKGLAVTLDRPVVTATQAATIVEEKTQRGKSFGRLDVYGSKRKVHAANTLAGITEHSKVEDEHSAGLEDWQKDVYWRVRVTKNRDGPEFIFYVRRYVKTGRVEEVKALDSKIQDDVDKAIQLRKQTKTAATAAAAPGQAVQEAENVPQNSAPDPPANVSSEDQEAQQRIDIANRLKERLSKRRSSS